MRNLIIVVYQLVRIAGSTWVGSAIGAAHNTPHALARTRDRRHYTVDVSGDQGRALHG